MKQFTKTRTILFVVLIAGLCGFLRAQDKDSLNAICKERGHLLLQYGVTAMYCPPEVIELENKTIMIYFDRNQKHGYCSRCGKEIYEPVQAKPDTVVIWERK
jgi:hypothetical protein